MALIGLAKIRKIIRIHLEKTKTNVIGELRNIKFTLTNWSFDGNDLTWTASRFFFKCFIANITKEDGAWDDVLSFLSSDPGLIYSWSVNRFAYIFVCFFSSEQHICLSLVYFYLKSNSFHSPITRPPVGVLVLSTVWFAWYWSMSILCLSICPLAVTDNKSTIHFRRQLDFVVTIY